MSSESQFDNGIATTMGGAVLTSVSISTWEAKRVSRELARAIASDRGIDARLVSSKLTIMEDPTLTAIYHLRDMTRRWWWQNSLPYRLKGIRIWPADIDRFTDHVLIVRDQMDALADDLTSNWTDRVEAQRQNLAGEFDRNQYPLAADVRSLFGIHIGQITPLYLDPEMLPQILRDNPEIARQQLDDAKSALAEGMGDIWRRVETSLEEMIKRLGGKGRIHESSTLMATLADLVGVLPKLNITNDPHLRTVAKDLKEKVLLLTDAQLAHAGKEQRSAIADAARSMIGSVKRRGVTTAPAMPATKATKAPTASVAPVARPVSRSVKQGYNL